MNLAVLYVAVPQAETMGAHRHVVFVDSGKTITSSCWGFGVMRS